MKKRSLLLLLFAVYLLLISDLSAQNLIPNGDFELGPDSSAEGWSLWWDSTCNNPVPVYGPDFWLLVSGTPDRLLEDDLFIGCDWDIDTAQSGKAWIDIADYDSVKTNLFSPLQKDSIYKLSYYASRESFSGTATHPQRLKFIFNNGGNSITTQYISLTQWNYFDTIFIATANSTELTLTAIDWVTSAFKLDNCSLNKNSTTYISPQQNVNEIISIFPNPANDKLTIKATLNIANIKIYNSVGIMIKQFWNFSAGEITTSEFPTGVYFIKASFSNQEDIQKIIIIH